ncbi:MAG: PD40 domain-containing protein [Deltaproteobacteria bacterium]|nr:PD40 domain-containing protein [Deltaproteobacteria bacterium]
MRLPVALALSLLLSNLACAKKKEPEDWDISSSPRWAKSWAATLSEGTWMSVDVHPSGERLVFDLLGDLYELPIGGGEAKRLTDGPSWDNDPRYSPDGERLLFVSDRDGNQELHILELKTGVTTKLTEGRPERFVEGEWSPDGQRVLARKRITDTRSIGMCELWLLDAKGGADGVRLTTTDELPFPNDATFSNDGRSIYFSSTPARFQYNQDPNHGLWELIRLDLETGERTQLTGESGGAFRPAVNPKTGELVILRRVAGKTVLERYDPASGARSRLGAVELDHDNQEGFTLNGVYPHTSFTPDGKNIVLWSKGKLVSVDAQGGVALPIPFSAKADHKLAAPVRFKHPVAKADEVRSKMLRWPSVSPKGDQIVFEALGRLWLQPVSGGAARAITDGSRRPIAPRWSDDGERLVYATWHDVEQGDVRVMTVATGAEERLTKAPAQYLAPAFSHDGTQITWLKGSGAPLRGHSTASELWFRLELREADGTVRDLGTIDGSGGANRGQPVTFTPDDQRLYKLTDEPTGAPNSAPKTTLVSIDLYGRDERVVARWERAAEVVVSPKGDAVAFVEGHKVYTAPLPLTGGQAIELNPKGGAFPVAAKSESAGDWLSWTTTDGPRWAMGPKLFGGAAPIDLDARLPRAKGYGKVAYVNARVLTMGAAGVIERGTIVVDGERIVSVGTSPPPPGVTVVDLGGKTVMPGLIDVHAHLHYGVSDAQPQRSWAHEINLAYGVTTVFDPSAHNDTVFATSERIDAGLELGPRVFSTGYILYGAKSKDRSDIQNLDDARMHLARMKAMGATGVKSYQQPARAQRQWVLAAATEEGLNVYPEGGGDLWQDLTMIVDGHTDIEHSLPNAPLYDDVIGLYAASGASYTPTLLVAYGGVSGENYYFQTEDLLNDPKFTRFTPAEWVDRNLRRRTLVINDEDWFHREVSKAAGELAAAGVKVNLGGHGQVQGIGPHWELWALAEGLGNEAALRAATINGAWTLGFEDDLGSVEVGKLADLIVIDGDPLADIRASVRITEVIKGGVRYDGETLKRVESTK